MGGWDGVRILNRDVRALNYDSCHLAFSNEFPLMETRDEWSSLFTHLLIFLNMHVYIRSFFIKL